MMKIARAGSVPLLRSSSSPCHRRQQQQQQQQQRARGDARLWQLSLLLLPPNPSLPLAAGVSEVLPYLSRARFENPGSAVLRHHQALG